MQMRRFVPVVLIVLIAFLRIQSSVAQSPRGNATRSSLSFTSDQVQRGRTVYDANCGSCHGPSLADGEAPSLIGRQFKSRWTQQSPAALRDYIRRRMPPGLVGTLSNDQYTQLVALLLKENGYQAGDVPLPTDDRPLDAIHMQFPGVLASTGGPLSLTATLPPWPTAVDPTQYLTPVTDEMLRNPPSGDWLTWRRTLDGQGFSPLTQITAANVQGLKLVWTQPLAPGPNLATPLVHDGVLFAASAGSNVDAMNAKTGEVLWTYRPESGAEDSASPSGIGIAAGRSNRTRNMALYGDKLFFPLGKGDFGAPTLGALDTRSGKLIWQTKLETGASGGPMAANGRVFQGLFRLPGPGGSMKALDASTGSPLWRWFTIPKTSEPHGDSWGDIPDDKRSGAGVWTTSYYDYDLNLMYFGTGNTYDTAWLATPPKTPGAHDALYTNSTIALNPVTGKLVWYFQHQAGDPFDLDYVFERVIVPLSINGKMTKVVVTMGKPGVLDALDASSGKYLFSMDAGIQNFITRIDPVTGAKAIDRSLIPVPGEEKIKTVCPNWNGVKNWLPGSVNPTTKVAYMALIESCMDLTPVYPGETAALTSGVMPQMRPVPKSDGRYGRMQAFDLQNRKVLWTERQHAPKTSGVLATAGGVVFSGALDRTFSAYDEKTGKELWSTRLGDVPSSAPITYMVDGKQYVAMVVGFGSMHSTAFIQLVPDIPLPTRPSSAIYVFALP
jgi:alcohol dehydrogenase (cytochrome c)